MIILPQAIAHLNGFIFEIYRLGCFGLPLLITGVTSSEKAVFQLADSDDDASYWWVEGKGKSDQQVT